MKLKGNKLGTIIASTGVVIFTLAATFSGTIAWFALSHKVSASGMQVKIEKEGTAVSSITIHEFYGIKKVDGVNYWGFNPSPSQSITVNNSVPSASGFTFNLNSFDLLNPHQPVLLLFEVTGGNETIKATSTNSYFAAPCPSVDTVADMTELNSYSGPKLVDGAQILVNNNGSNKKAVYKYHTDPTTGYDVIWTGDGVKENDNNAETHTDENPLSSAIETRSVTFTYNPKTQQTKTADFTGDGNSEEAIALTETQCTSSDKLARFVTFDDMNPTFESEISLFSEDTTGKQYVGLIFDYNSDALNYIYTYYLGTSIVSKSLLFSCDWSLKI